MTTPNPTVTVGALERLYTMSHHDRQCPGCGHPVMALVDETYPCPDCGRPTTDADKITRERARELRAERGLLR